jgi:16S rRNA (uracil1498-N3)-methyltransferase
MQHFFVEASQIQGNRICITGTDVNHIRNVLRMHPGEEISVSNGVDGREYRCEIDTISEDEVLCRLMFIKEDGVEQPVRITLFQGLPKADKMELIIQKATELGVCALVPLAAERSVVRLDEKKAGKKREHWQGIAEAAAKQSRRSVIPEIGAVMNMKEALKAAAGMELAVIPYELAEGMSATADFRKGVLKLAKENNGARVGIFIGPEGGFSEEEAAAAEAAGVKAISLGRRILRTETAGMSLLSYMMLRLEMEV